MRADSERRTNGGPATSLNTQIIYSMTLTLLHHIVRRHPWTGALPRSDDPVQARDRARVDERPHPLIPRFAPDPSVSWREGHRAPVAVASARRSARLARAGRLGGVDLALVEAEWLALRITLALDTVGPRRSRASSVLPQSSCSMEPSGSNSGFSWMDRAGQGCSAASPASTYRGMSFVRMRVKLPATQETARSGGWTGRMFCPPKPTSQPGGHARPATPGPGPELLAGWGQPPRGMLQHPLPEQG